METFKGNLVSRDLKSVALYLIKDKGISRRALHDAVEKAMNPPWPDAKMRIVGTDYLLQQKAALERSIKKIPRPASPKGLLAKVPAAASEGGFPGQAPVRFRKASLTTSLQEAISFSSLIFISRENPRKKNLKSASILTIKLPSACSPRSSCPHLRCLLRHQPCTRGKENHHHRFFRAACRSASVRSSSSLALPGKIALDDGPSSRR
jgi:hypothetical protein